LQVLFFLHGSCCRRLEDQEPVLFSDWNPPGRQEAARARVRSLEL
jgi:hypothetical protein